MWELSFMNEPQLCMHNINVKGLLQEFYSAAINKAIATSRQEKGKQGLIIVLVLLSRIFLSILFY
jgi:hypothetical protein